VMWPTLYGKERDCPFACNNNQINKFYADRQGSVPFIFVYFATLRSVSIISSTLFCVVLGHWSCAVQRWMGKFVCNIPQMFYRGC